MATFEEWTLFLASPGDVNPERAVVRRVVEELNQSVGKRHGIRVEVNGWETHARPAWGRDGQAIINDQIADMKKHELFVGIMWNRFGTKTPRAASGTREEFDLAVTARGRTRGKRPEIMFYFGTAPYSPKGKADNAQKDLVFDFKTEIEKKKRGLYWTFNGTAEFETLFRKHYSDWLNAKITARGAAKVKRPPTSKPTKRAPKTETSVSTLPKPVPKPRTTKPKWKPILINGELFFAENIVEVGTKRTLLLRPQTPAQDRKIRELCGQQQWHREFALVYDLQAGRAQVLKDGARIDDARGGLWTVEVRFIPTATHSYRINFQNKSADEIARERARWLLLEEEPPVPAPRHAWEVPDRHLIAHIKGSGAKAQPILAALWKKLQGDAVRFAMMAPLVAQSLLLEAGVCDHVDEMKIGPVRAGKVSVHFRGTSSSNAHEEAQSIEVKGTCALPPFETKPAK